MTVAIDLSALQAFLPCATPAAWLAAAAHPDNLETLLIDHANCEKKAAGTALTLLYRYTDDFALQHRLSRLAREELRHFEQVLAILEQRGIAYAPLSASRYAGGLRAAVRREEPQRLLDTLLVGALIEARSCERFAALAPRLDRELAAFYGSLLKSEARHFRDYLALAEGVAGTAAVVARLPALKALEADLVQKPDRDFRFHSGPPGPLS